MIREHGSRPNPVRARTHRRIHGTVFPHYAIENLLNIGVERIKDIPDLRKRAVKMQQDDALWLLIEDWSKARKLEAAALRNIELHMTSHYGKKAK